jgi:Flp pilus assembly protein TadD
MFLLAGGCGHTSSPARAGYEATANDHRRNAELAKQKNAEGIEQLRCARYADAERTLKESLEADVTFGPAHNNLGKVYYHEGQFYDAAWEFQYAAKLMPDLPEPRNNLGLVLEAVGKLDDAVSSYDEALKIRPDNAQFLGNDARARFRRGDHDDRLRVMLQDLVMRDTRQEWAEWAKEQLARLGAAAATRPSRF